MSNFRRYLPLIATALVIALPLFAHACPNCKNSLPDSDDGGLITRLRDGYFWSYVGMSSMPFIALGTIGYKLYRSIQKADNALQAESNPS